MKKYLPVLKLKGKGWNALNNTMNSSPVLQKKLSDVANEIAEVAREEITNIQGPDARLAQEVQANVGPPRRKKVGVSVRFVSHPSASYEMMYSPLYEGVYRVIDKS